MASQQSPLAAPGATTVHMNSKSLDEMLNSTEVDESTISALVGTLENSIDSLATVALAGTGANHVGNSDSASSSSASQNLLSNNNNSNSSPATNSPNATPGSEVGKRILLSANAQPVNCSVCACLLLCFVFSRSCVSLLFSP